MLEDDYGWVSWLVILALIWGGYSLFKTDDSSKSENNFRSIVQFGSGRENATEADGYIWAEDNNISSFGECQTQFGTGYEEDECNRYVKENYSEQDSFNGYECTEDCSGHEAGYNWAEENGIYDEYECDGNSNSFNEGCISYVEENY